MLTLKNNQMKMGMDDDDLRCCYCRTEDNMQMNNGQMDGQMDGRRSYDQYPIRSLEKTYEIVSNKDNSREFSDFY